MPSLVIGTAGHVDHGKSALVRALTGIDPDRLKEEQQRGITIDLGFAHTAVGEVEIAFVDVPGHERFVRNMLAGAGGFDAVLLVVAADESVKPQTREHTAICRLLGVERGVIVLAKSDLVDEDTLALAALEVRELVAGTFLERAPIVPVSSRTGAGLDVLRAALAALATVPRTAIRRDAARLAIDRVFTAKGFGTVVTGTLTSGSIAVDDDVELLPEGRIVRVRGVHVHSQAVARADAPRRVAVNLGGVATTDVRRGVTLAAPGTLAAGRRLDVEIELLAAAPALRHGSRVRVHLGTSEVGARVAIAATRAADGDTAPWQPAAIGEARVSVLPGGRGWARLRLDEAVAATRGDRLVLRAFSPAATIGGAVVLDPEPPERGLRRAHALARFAALAEPVPAAAGGAPLAFLTDSGARGVAPADLVRRAGLGAADAALALGAWAASGQALVHGDRACDIEAVRAAESAILAALASDHRARPEAAGLARETLRARAARTAESAWFDWVLERLATRGATTGTDTIALHGHRPVVEAGGNEVRAAILDALAKAGLSPPDAAGLVTAIGRDAATIDRATHALLRERRLVRAGDVVFHADVLARLKEDVRQMASAAQAAGRQAQLDVGTFKSSYGLTRKYAIPLLEWLDRERVTRRVGDNRVVL